MVIPIKHTYDPNLTLGELAAMTPDAQDDIILQVQQHTPNYGVPCCFMVSGEILCPMCFRQANVPETAESIRYTRVFPINMGRYNQDCHKCGQAIHIGSFGTQLYENPNE